MNKTIKRISQFRNAILVILPENVQITPKGDSLRGLNFQRFLMFAPGGIWVNVSPTDIDKIRTLHGGETGGALELHRGWERRDIDVKESLLSEGTLIEGVRVRIFYRNSLWEIGVRLVAERDRPDYIWYRVSDEVGEGVVRSLFEVIGGTWKSPTQDSMERLLFAAKCLQERIAVEEKSGGEP